MDREIYLWIGIFILIIAAGSYYRLFYKPAIGISVTIGQDNSFKSVYPYQHINVPVAVVNTGSSNIQNIVLGISLNGNLSTVYKVTLPAGKQSTFFYNITPATPGTYNLTSVVDPDKLYNIANRAAARSSFVLTVKTPQPPIAFTLLPRQNIISGNVTQMSSSGYVASSYMFFNYSLNKVALTPIFGLKSFLYPLFDVVYPYIKGIDDANAAYENYSVYSVWVRGYLSPNIIYSGAFGKSLNVTNYTVTGKNLTFINFGNATTLCSWYDGGWIKIIGVGGSRSCLDIVKLANTSTLNASFSSPYYSRLVAPYDNIIANNTGFAKNSVTAGILTIPTGGNVLMYKTITTNNVGGNTCYGIISYVNGTNYCSYFVSPKYPPSRSNFSMIGTTAFVNGFNITDLSIVNTSRILGQPSVNIAVLKSLNITGSSLSFISGIRNSCQLFNYSLLCSNVTFQNSTISFLVRNNFTSQIKLVSSACSWHGNLIFKAINKTVPSGGYYNVTSACYDSGNAVSGIPLGLHLRLGLNYTLASTTNSVNGYAYII